jgi:hypothetical protein
MSFNTTDITNGVSISGSTSPFNTYIKTENAGVYDIQFSAQVDKTDSGTDEIWIWLRKNGTNLQDTATSIQLTGNGDHYVAAWNFFVNSAANDYYQLMWYSPDANVRLHAEPGFGVVPGIPSVIATVNRVDQFLSNTGSFSGSFNGQFTGSLLGTATTASFVQTAQTASFVTLAQTASFVQNAVSSSFAATASFALNSGGSGVGFPFSGSAVITGSFLVSQSFVDFTQASYVTGSFTGSLLGTASYATTASYAMFALTASTAPGYTVQFTQSVAAATWSFDHNMNTRNPIVQVYDSSYKQIIPNDIIGVSVNTAEIRFDYATTGYVVMSNGGGLYVTGSTSMLTQTSAATTWSFTHNLNSKYVNFETYDSGDNVIIPAGIHVIDTNNAELYFATATSGIAIAQFSGINGAPNATTASYALTATSASYALNATTASYALTATSASYALTATSASFASTASYLNPIQNSYVILSQVSASLNYADDDAAAVGGVPLGGLYRNGNFILIRVGGSATPTYTIGQAALGGKIAYILQPGDPGYDAGVQHGLVATAADIVNKPWGCGGTLIAGADGTAIGTGNQNTIDIMAGCATADIAARVCGDLTEGGYSDWYLPSKDELNKLYINRVAIGNFNASSYWSSSEVNANQAYYQVFFTGDQLPESKSTGLTIRPIRSF